MKSSFSYRVLLVFFWSLSLVAIAPSMAHCGDSNYCCRQDCRGAHCSSGDTFWSIHGSDWIFDDTTRAAWYRTWHAPNALATPLRQYYIPRDWKWCDFKDRDGAESCQDGGNYPAGAALGFDPVTFERLGKVPNDFALGDVAPTANAGR